MFKRTLSYYTSFRDSDGHEHFAVHGYDRLNGFVTMMRDFKFPNAPSEPKRFQVIFDSLDETYKVLDSKNGVSVATFYNESDAQKFCEMKNIDETYLDDMENTPWS